MTREEILDKVLHCTPNLGWDYEYPDLFGKYGLTICGICDGWRWFTEENITDYARKNGHLPITDASTEELLEMWAVADHYWLECYEDWFRRSEQKSAKLDRFIGYCERNYYGYDDKYTLDTIDQILEFAKRDLDNVYHAEDEL